MIKRKTKWFDTCPKTSLAILVILFIFLIDFISALLFIPRDYNAYRCPSPWNHHDLKPNQHEASLWGDQEYELFTNSLGFKDASTRAISNDIPSGKRRILLMGDSFTEGVGMDWPESFAGILSRNNPNIEFLNAAVVSYSPKFYFLKTKYLLENRGLKFKELFVFIDNSDPMNEISYESFKPYDKNTFKKFGISLQQFLYHYSYLYYSITSIFMKDQRNRVTDSWNRILGEAFVDEVESSDNEFLAHMLDWSYNPMAYGKWGKKGLQLCKQNMEKLDALCQQYNIRLTLVIYPWPSIISQNNPDNIQVSFWQTFADEHQRRLINLYPVFMNGDDPASIRKSYFIPGDVHWNKKGHQLVAQKIQEYLKRNSLN